MIRNRQGQYLTYRVMMETQVAHETAELLVLQGRASKDGI